MSAHLAHSTFHSPPFGARSLAQNANFTLSHCIPHVSTQFLHPALIAHSVHTTASLTTSTGRLLLRVVVVHVDLSTVGAERGRCLGLGLRIDQTGLDVPEIRFVLLSS